MARNLPYTHDDSSFRNLKITTYEEVFLPFLPPSGLTTFCSVHKKVIEPSYTTRKCCTDLDDCSFITPIRLLLGPTICGYYYAACYHQKHRSHMTTAEYKDFCLPFHMVKALTGLPDKILQTPLGNSFVHPRSVTTNQALDFRGIPGTEAPFRRLLIQEIIETKRMAEAESAPIRRISLIPEHVTWQSVLESPMQDPELLWAYPAEACLRSEEQERTCANNVVEIPRFRR